MKLIQSKTFEQARREIRALQKKAPQLNSSAPKTPGVGGRGVGGGTEIIFTSLNDDLNRKILEKEKIHSLLIPLANRKDFQKQRDSGFNQVLAKIAKENKIQISINLDEIVESDKYKKSQILARLRQNIKLCNKHKIQMNFAITKKANERNLHDLKALGLVLGMPTWMTKSLSIQSFFN